MPNIVLSWVRYPSKGNQNRRNEFIQFGKRELVEKGKFSFFFQAFFWLP